MTLTLETRQQLVAPRRLRSMPPSFVGPPTHELPTGLPFERADLPPSFVTNARALVERHPSSPTALARLAQAEQAAGNLQEAVAAARATLAQATEHPDLSAELGAITVLVASGSTAEAEQELARFAPEGPLAVVYAELAAERNGFEEALDRLEGENSAEAWTLRGWVKLKQGDYRGAIHSFRRAMRESGPTPAVLTNIGLAHAALGERKRAIVETRQALALVPSRMNRVAFNLASYYMAGGDYQEALAVIRSRQDASPRDIEPLFAEARVHLAVGEFERARRPLRRARTSLWAYLGDRERAELNANLIFVDWHLDGISTRQAAGKVVRELQRIDYSSLPIAEMLTVLLPNFSDLDLFRKVLARVRQAHPRESLRGLEVHRAVLERRFHDATELAVQWANECIFDSVPAVIASYLLCDVAGDFPRAVEIGQAALRRTPANSLLSNNVAYALALSGRPTEAKRWMPPQDTPHHIATRALVALRAGRRDEARAGYEASFTEAKDSNASGLPALVLLHAHMAFADFAPEVEPPASVKEGTELPEGWDDDPRFAITLMMLEKRDIPLPAWFPGSDRVTSTVVSQNPT